MTDPPKTDRCGRNSVPYRAKQIWNLLSLEIKNSANLDSLKFKIKQCWLECYVKQNYRIWDIHKVEFYWPVAILYLFNVK